MVSFAVDSVAGGVGNSFATLLNQLFPQLALANNWLVFVILLVVAIAISQVITWLVRVIATSVTSKTKTQADDILLKSMQQPFAWLIFTVLVYFAFVPLDFSPNVAAFLRSILLSLNILAIAFLIHRFAGAFFLIWKETVATRTDSELDETMLPIVSKFIVVVIWIVAVLLVMGSWGVQVGPFLAGLGIAGIALGFALKDSLGHIISGVSLAFDGAYKVGDRVKLEDGTTGTVYDITLRSTRIQTFDGDILMVPNSNMANTNIYTYAKPNKQSRMQVRFGVEYGSDIVKVQKVALNVVKKMEGILDDPAPSCWFTDMADSSLNFTLNFWVGDYHSGFEKKLESRHKLYEALKKHKIGIPYPTRTVHVKKAK